MGQTFIEQDHVMIIKTNGLLQNKNKSKTLIIIVLCVLADINMSGYTSIDVTLKLNKVIY